VFSGQRQVGTDDKLDMTVVGNDEGMNDGELVG